MNFWDRPEPEAARLRREGKLWPQTLSDADLAHEVDAIKPETPISNRMVLDEVARRQSKVNARVRA